MVRVGVFVALAWLLAAPVPGVGAEANYLSPQDVPLSKILSPPPTPGSAEDQKDLAAVLEAQRTRTAEQSTRAIADYDFSISRQVLNTLGPDFTAARVPKTAELLERCDDDARSILTATKTSWRRPRPFVTHPDVHPVGERPSSWSYPSSHALQGYLNMMILANMVPEKADALFARGREYGTSRVLAGVHYPTDTEAGRLAATAIAAQLFHNGRFLRDYEDAKAELRNFLNSYSR